MNFIDTFLNCQLWKKNSTYKVWSFYTD